MDIAGKVAVVTGAAAGIGRALCVALHNAGAAKVVAVDLDLKGAEETAKIVSGEAFEVDVADEQAIAALVDKVEAEIGPIALFCSNAGIATGMNTTFDNIAFADTAVWDRAWSVNVMAHVYAARVLILLMKERGEGYFLNTVSAAGVLSQIGSAVYSTTKHAAVGFGESLAIGHRDDGIRVSLLCPQGVDTAMIAGMGEGPQLGDGILSAEAVAESALRGIADERFMILPHENVADYMRGKVENYDRWIGGMAKLQRSFKTSS